MIIFKHTSAIRSYLLAKKATNTTIGFIPTMGALHGGHITLVTKASNETQLVVCSIFVNPTQFNDLKDFEKYPSTLENDVFLLEKAGCHVLFLPSVAEIYPDGAETAPHFDLGVLETMLEGKFRPGHFQGVCQVVHRLLEIVVPSKLYLGQKDFQQCLVLKKLVEMMGIDTTVMIAATKREPDGLAMSSRNLRLTEADREKAPLIYSSLLSIQRDIQAGDILHLTEKAKKLLNENGFKVDYIEIADAATLTPVQEWDGKMQLVILAAAYLNDIRLIDNLIL